MMEFREQLFVSFMQRSYLPIISSKLGFEDSLYQTVNFIKYHPLLQNMLLDNHNNISVTYGSN